MVVGAEFRRVHRLSVAVLATTQGRSKLKALHRLHQELHSLDPGNIADRESKIDVQHVAEAGTRIADPQSEAHVLEQSRITVADDAAAPGTADIRKNSAPDPYQAIGIPIGEKSLLHRQQRARGARLEAQWITAQTVVAAEQQLHVGIEHVGRGPREPG